MRMAYPFSSDEAQRAHEEWGANCGPGALAFALQLPIDDVRGLIPDFERKRYTSPTMMRAALASRGQLFREVNPSKDTMFQWNPAIVRVQWTGPWLQPGADPRWAYKMTHWVATYMVERQCPMVFDFNTGIRTFGKWQREVVLMLTAQHEKADGGWFPTHVWVLVKEHER